MTYAILAAEQRVREAEERLRQIEAEERRLTVVAGRLDMATQPSAIDSAFDALAGFSVSLILGLLVLVGLLMFSGCIVYEVDPPSHHTSKVVVVNDPYCDDVGVKGFWCTEEGAKW